MKSRDEQKRRVIAQALVTWVATIYAKKKYRWKHIGARIVSQQDDESFRLRVKEIDMDGDQIGNPIELKVNLHVTIEELHSD